MIDEKMKMNSIKDMMLGKLAPLVSTFRLSYYTILNLLIHAQGQFPAEHVIKNSFHQFQYEKALPDSGKKVFKLEEEAAKLDALGEGEVAEYDKLKLEIAQREKKKMMVELHGLKGFSIFFFLVGWSRYEKVEKIGVGVLYSMW
ncbi:DExH-box ATP-dependent RNA helicase DExH10 [Capsicum chacoense]